MKRIDKKEFINSGKKALATIIKEGSVVITEHGKDRFILMAAAITKDIDTKWSVSKH